MNKIVLITLLILTMLISSASAVSELKETIREISSDYWTETKKIDFNEYLVYKFQGRMTDTVEISMEVVRGDSIDTFILSAENFTDYQSMMQSGKSRPYYPYSDGKGMNFKYLSYSFEIPADGTYYIVEDNTYLPNNGGAPGGSVDVKINFNRKRCIECEEAALEIQKRNQEEEARRIEEAQRRLQEEMNKSTPPKPTPGFEMIFSVLVLEGIYIFGRKKEF